MKFPVDPVKEVVYELKYSGPEVSAISFPTIQDGTLQEMVLFISPPAPVCLLPTFPKRKLLLSASPLIWDKMVILDSAMAGESSIQGFWIYTCMFPIHFLKQQWRLLLFIFLKLRVNSLFLGRGRCQVKQLEFSLKTYSPKIHYFAWNHIAFSEKLIAVKFSWNCNFIFDQWEKNRWV